MSKRKQKVHLLTLGCPKNTVDSEILLKQLTANNMELVSSSDDSDTVIINTCGFIRSAKQESLDTVMHAVQLKKEGRIQKLVVMGCLAERYAGELKKEIPEVDAYIGANKIDEVVKMLGGNLKYELLGERVLITPHHYAYLKISEGCDRPCSFCSIPMIRGKHVSRPMNALIEEVKHLAGAGVKELIVIAQDSTYYGLDLYGKRMLAVLLENLSKVSGIEWIRLMYAFPAGFPLEVLEQINQNPKICKYLDIPVQHISDSILTSMRRGIHSYELRTLLEKIRTKVPTIVLRTTVIVGYPGEGEKEFSELHEFVRELQFERLGVFTYSQEEDTSAYDLGDPIPAGIKETRLNTIMETQREISFQNNQRFVGRTVKVLIDSCNDNTAVGRMEFDAPEIDNEVIVSQPGTVSVGEFYPVEIIDAEAYDIFGSMESKSEVFQNTAANRAT